MRRLFGVLVVVAVAMLPAYAAAQATTPAAKAPAAKAPAAKMLKATGTVSAVSTDSLTIKEKAGDVTFAVDSKTRVTGAGASRITAEAKAQKKTTVLTDFIKDGELVTVTYHEADGIKHAASVRVMASAKK